MNMQRFTIVPGHLDPHPKGELVRYAEFAHIQAKLGETNKVLHEAQESIRELQRIMLIARNQHAIDFEKIEAKNERLKEFACYVIRQECWSIFPQDGGDIQELAEKLDLIVPCIATEEDVDDESDFEVGDTFYKFTDMLKEDKP